MTTPTPSLDQVLTFLLGQPERISRELKRGLRLTYTPSRLNQGTFRLTLAREGVFPSNGGPNSETEIVKQLLKRVLAKLDRPYTYMIVKPYLRHGRSYYHAIEWEELAALETTTWCVDKINDGDIEYRLAVIDPESTRPLWDDVLRGLDALYQHWANNDMTPTDDVMMAFSGLMETYDKWLLD